MYVTKVEDFPPGYCDLIVIDGSFRFLCFITPWDHLKRTGLLVVENTDMDGAKRVDQAISGHEIANVSYVRFGGWFLENFFPTENTICVLKDPTEPSVRNHAV